MDAITGTDGSTLSEFSLSFIPNSQGGILLFSGDSLSDIAAQLVGWRVSQSERVLFLDGDNRFNPYPIAALAKRMGYDPGRFLSSIFISRAFTCHQMTSLITHQLRTAITHRRPRLVILAEPMATFYDEAISHAERKTLLTRAAATLSELAKEGVFIVILTTPPPRMPKTLSLFSILRDIADRRFSVQTHEKEILIQEEGSSLDDRLPPHRIRRG